MTNKITRRSFIKKSGVVTSLFSLSSQSIFSSSTDDNRIIVVGAGLAGLSCAHEFSDNLYSEMGAEYVDSTDMYVQDYCRKFNLKILPARQYDGVYVRGNELSMDRIRSGEDLAVFGRLVSYL